MRNTSGKGAMKLRKKTATGKFRPWIWHGHCIVCCSLAKFNQVTQSLTAIQPVILWRQIEPSNAIHAGEVHASRENSELSLALLTLA